MWPGAQGLFNHHNSSRLRTSYLPPPHHKYTLDGLVRAEAAAKSNSKSCQIESETSSERGENCLEKLFAGFGLIFQIEIKNCIRNLQNM